MNSKTHISIVGYGYVGKSVEKLLLKKSLTAIYPIDPKIDNITQDFKNNNLRRSDFIFVCVPTPMIKKTGAADTSIVESVISEISEITKGLHSVIVIKSTVPPGTTERLADKYGLWDRLNFSPEFVVERTRKEDNSRMIVGGSNRYEVLELFQPLLDDGAQLIAASSPAAAEMTKYMTNAFLSTKVSFAVEMNMICQMFGLNYNEIVTLFESDPRVGKTHNRVIRDDDGNTGYGGKCLPKDMSALMSHVISKNELSKSGLSLMNAVLKYKLNE